MRIILLMAVIMLSACSPNNSFYNAFHDGIENVKYNLNPPALVITFKSDPSGAVLYEENKSFGRTPFSLSYGLSKADIKNGFKIIKPLHIRWPSGATAVFENSRIDLSKGYYQEYTFFRPKNIPGREQDVSYGLEIEKIMMQQAFAQQQQYELEQRQEQARLGDAIRSGLSAMEEQRKEARENYQRELDRQAMRRSHCRSHVFGNQIITDCD